MFGGMEMSKVVGDKIKSIRLEYGETLEEFGKRFSPHASDSIVSRWEKGKSLPSPKRLRAIAELGSMTVDELLRDNCQLCNDQSFRADCYESNRELSASYFVADDRKIITVIYAGEEYLGFSEIDISYCPECGRKLEVKQ